MTTRDHARRTAQRFGSERDIADPGPGLPDRLSAARERKGVDLVRAERDTKIRVRYLSALERGDYRDLPGAVYTKGFLRNYAIYLGLDPEDVLRQWRRERGEQTAPEPAIVPPRPLEEPSRPLHFSPSVVVAALLTAGVVLFFVYLGSQLLRYSRPPDLTVTDPATAVVTVQNDATTYYLAGMTSPGAVVTVAVAGRPDITASAQSTGAWSIQVDLRRGQNRFQITARNPETGKEAETPRDVVITVPFLEFQAPTLTVSTPVEGTSYGNGAVAVEGTTTNAATVTVTEQFLGAAPGAPAPAPTPKASGGPKPSTGPGATVNVADDGSYTFSPLDLTAGRWAITVTATSTEGKTASLTRNVTVAYSGVNLIVSMRGGPAWIKVWVDGKLVGSQAGQVYQAGRSLTFSGKTSVEVRTGSSGSTRFTLNGVDLGSLGKAGIPETWLFAPPASPVKTTRA